MVEIRETRRSKRAKYAATVHFGELDDDADRFEDAVLMLNRRISKLTGVGIGILVSLTTTSLLLLVNLAGR